MQSGPTEFRRKYAGYDRATAIGAITNLKQKRCIQHKVAVKYAEDFVGSRTVKAPTLCRLPQG
jgi:hypothetical protein